MNLCINCKHVLVLKETANLPEEIVCIRRISPITGKNYGVSCFRERMNSPDRCGEDGIFYEPKLK